MQIVVISIILRNLLTMSISLDIGILLLLILTFFLLETFKLHSCPSIIIRIIVPRDHEIIVLNRDWKGALIMISLL